MEGWMPDTVQKTMPNICIASRLRSHLWIKLVFREFQVIQNWDMYPHPRTHHLKRCATWWNNSRQLNIHCRYFSRFLSFWLHRSPGYSFRADPPLNAPYSRFPLRALKTFAFAFQMFLYIVSDKYMQIQKRPHLPRRPRKPNEGWSSWHTVKNHSFPFWVSVRLFSTAKGKFFDGVRQVTNGHRANHGEVPLLIKSAYSTHRQILLSAFALNCKSL